MVSWFAFVLATFEQEVFWHLCAYVWLKLCQTFDLHTRMQSVCKSWCHNELINYDICFWAPALGSSFIHFQLHCFHLNLFYFILSWMSKFYKATKKFHDHVYIVFSYVWMIFWTVFRRSCIHLNSIRKWWLQNWVVSFSSTN